MDGGLTPSVNLENFCFNSNLPLYDGGFDPPTRICGFCAAQAVGPDHAPTPARPGASPAS